MNDKIKFSETHARNAV